MAATESTAWPDEPELPPPARRIGMWTWIALAEVAIAAFIVTTNVFIPTLILLVVAVFSLLLRWEWFPSIGFHRIPQVGEAALTILAMTVGWTLLQITFFLPVFERLTGEEQDVTQFEGLQGDLALLAFWLLIGWTVAAIGEETVYRGYIFTRVTDFFGTRVPGVVTAIALTSVLFSIAHSEQGVVGMLMALVDALFFCIIRQRYGSVWAPVMAHGFVNTIGLTAFYFAGPVRALW